MHPDILPLHAAIESRHWWFVARYRIVSRLLSSVEPPHPAKTVLDLGCGTGWTISEIARDYRGIGIELDEHAVEFAAQAYPRCRFICGNALDPDSWLLDISPDVCLIMDVLEHLDDDRSAVENAAAMLRPGGHLLITVPAGPGLWSRHDRHHDHRRRYTREGLATLLAGLGLRQRLLSHFNSRLYPLVKMSRWLQNRIPVFGDRGTTGDLTMPPSFVNRILTCIFESEVRRLSKALEQGEPAFRYGVSLIAVYQKQGAS